MVAKSKRAKKTEKDLRAERFAGAMILVKESGVSLARAAALFGVTKTSLQRRTSKKVPVDAKAGRKHLLSQAEEKGLIEVTLYQSKRGICMTDGELRILARKIALSKGVPAPALLPSERWPACFVKRHRDRLTRKRSQILDIKL
ncbi:hypothetical protein V7S43_013135 [Phytophthora oleae]|uniref:HTH CENPB-type domain-containing protein n=1 Tax=Phytophthora oleae TaxID=2107226 RepID=A0ABD3F841_9STRA